PVLVADGLQVVRDGDALHRPQEVVALANAGALGNDLPAALATADRPADGRPQGQQSGADRGVVGRVARGGLWGRGLVLSLYSRAQGHLCDVAVLHRQAEQTSAGHGSRGTEPGAPTERHVAPAAVGVLAVAIAGVEPGQGAIDRNPVAARNPQAEGGKLG